jgi:hypothetical protein
MEVSRIEITILSINFTVRLQKNLIIRFMSQEVFLKKCDIILFKFYFNFYLKIFEG